MCNMSHVTCHVSCVIFTFSFLFFLLDKEVQLVGGGSVINGAYPVEFYMYLTDPMSPGLFYKQPCLRMIILCLIWNIYIWPFTSSTDPTIYEIGRLLPWAERLRYLFQEPDEGWRLSQKGFIYFVRHSASLGEDKFAMWETTPSCERQTDWEKYQEALFGTYFIKLVGFVIIHSTPGNLRQEHPSDASFRQLWLPPDDGFLG